MATQHPDNASVPWWRSNAFIPTQDEIDELLLLFRELHVDEYMWDWEGKYVDEAVGEKLFSRARDFFAAHPLGEDFHLTYRIPAYEDGKLHRMARAFMNVLSLADFAKDIGLPRPPVTELFLPLTTSAEQPMKVRQAFRDVADYHRAVFHESRKDEDALLKLFRVTPLVEDMPSLFAIDRIVEPFWAERLKEDKGIAERGQRVFLARSDPALNAGLVAAVLAVKAALSITKDVGERLGFPVHPIIGTGSLPFRGSVNPTYTESFLTQYSGVRTYSIQSAFRYDYPLEEVKRAIALIREEAPKRAVERFDAKDIAAMRELADVFARHWKPTIEGLAPMINTIAAFVPPRRERLQHIGLFGYNRGVGNVKLPRAITFTAAFYSIGVPPELVATGRGLKEAQKKGLLPILERAYPALRADLQHAGKYLNRENLALLAAEDRAFADIQEDVRGIEEILKIQLVPQKPHHLIHRNLTSTILQRLRDNPTPEILTRDIVEAGLIRRSLG